MAPRGKQQAAALPAEALALLERAQELLERGFTYRAYARDRHGHPVNPSSERARRFCAVGALVRAEYDLHGELFEQVEVAEGIEGTPRFLLALAHLNVACSAVVVAPLLYGAPEVAQVLVEEVLTGPQRQLPDRVNDLPGIGRKQILACYALALRLARAGVRKAERA